MGDCMLRLQDNPSALSKDSALHLTRVNSMMIYENSKPSLVELCKYVNQYSQGWMHP